MSFNLPKTDKKRVVIVGGGFGGLKLANQLRKGPFQVVLIDRNNYHQFPPLIYQIASAGIEPSSISFPFRKIFQKRKNCFFRMAEVRSIFPEHKIIQTSIGKVSYDYLILAAGATTNFFGNANVAAEAMPMKNVSESMGLRNPDLPTSLMHIYLIEAGPRLLPAMSEESSHKVEHYLRTMGVNVLLNKMVTDYKDHCVMLKDGSSIATRTFIWVSGVAAQPVGNLDPSHLGRGRRIIVDAFNRVPGLDGVFSIGDQCIMPEGDDEWKGGHPQLAQVAIQQGKLLAKNLQRLEAGKELKPFRYKNLGTMATVGRNRAVAEFSKMKFGGFMAWFLWLVVHLRSILGVRNKMIVLLNWLWYYVSYSQSLRMIIYAKKAKEVIEREQRLASTHWGTDLMSEGSEDTRDNQPGEQK